MGKGGGNSGSQKGRQCQLSCTPNTQTTLVDWERSLEPSGIVVLEMSVKQVGGAWWYPSIPRSQDWACGPSAFPICFFLFF